MRTRAGLVLVFFLLLAGGGCRREVTPAPPPPGTFTLPPEPPRLSLRLGEQAVAAAVAAQAWPDPVERAEPPDELRLFLEPGREIAFTLEGISLAPGAARLELWHDWFWHPWEGARPARTEDIATFQVAGDGFAFAWTMPQLPYMETTHNTYTLRVEVAWGDARAIYQAGLQVVTEPTWLAVRDTARRFFEAAWTGDQAVVTALLTPPRRGEQGTWPSPGPLAVYDRSAWELILWRSEEYEYRLRAGPVVRVKSVGPGPGGPHALAEVDYSVEAVERRSGTAWRWDFTERYELLDVDGWRVDGMGRSGVPWESAGGTEPGRQVKAVAEGALLRVGPFAIAGTWFGQAWSDDGQLFALAGTNFDWSEVWAFRRDGSGLCRLLRVAQYPQRWGHPALYVLNWATGGSAVRFAVLGPQLDGPYAGREGIWVAEAAYPGGEIRDLAFIPRRGADRSRPELTADGASVLFQCSPALWRVDLAPGEAVHLADDLPNWDGLFRLHYSPSGWRGAYALSHQKQVVVYDLRGGTRREITLPEAELAFLAGWGPQDLVAVALALESELLEGDDFSWPAAAASLRFYDAFPGEPELRLEITPPGDDPACRVGLWAWNPGGDRLAFTVGPVVPAGPHPLGYDSRVQEVQELWLWWDGAAERLAVLSGHGQALRWTPGGGAVEVWWTYPQGSRQQTGVRAYLDGRTESLLRDPWVQPLPAPPGETWYAMEWEPGIQRVVAHGPGGPQVLVEGPFQVRDARVERGTLVFMSEALEGLSHPWAGYLHLLKLED